MFVDVTSWHEATGRQRHCLRLLAVQLGAPDAACFELSAAVLWGLPVRKIPDVATVIRERDGHRVAGATVRRVQTCCEDITTLGGLRTTNLERTVLDVAAGVPMPDALITIDAALRRGVRRERVRELAHTRLSRRSRNIALSAVEAGDGASESPLESLSRGRMIERQMPLPLINAVVRQGRREARVDDLWVEDGIVGECDGREKYDDESVNVVLWKEKRRQEWLEDLTLEVVRWGYPEVADDGRPMEARYRRAVTRQQRCKFTWPGDVRIEVPTLPGYTRSAAVNAEISRLRRAGYPIVETKGARPRR